MKYKNISIKGYRGIKELELNGLGNVNLILGQNNVGKSSILEAIFLLTGFRNPQNSMNVDSFRNLLHNELEDFRFIFYNLDYKNQILLSTDMFTDDENRRLEIIPKSSIKSQIINRSDVSSSSTTENAKNELGIASSRLDLPQATVDSLQFKSEIKKRHTQTKHFSSTLKVTKTLLTGLEFTVENVGKDAFDSENFKAHYHGNNISNPGDLVKRVEDMIISKKKDQLIRGLQLIDDKVKDIITAKLAMIFVDVSAEKMLPTNLMGDGFHKFINIITKLNAVENGVLLLDEIENGLHFSSLKKLWRLILIYSKALNIQIFVTTHSKEALINLKEVLEAEDMSEYRDGVVNFTISKLSSDILKAYSYDYPSFEYAIENDVEIRGEI